jgi:hypothetical protein
VNLKTPGVGKPCAALYYFLFIFKRKEINFANHCARPPSSFLFGQIVTHF